MAELIYSPPNCKTGIAVVSIRFHMRKALILKRRLIALAIATATMVTGASAANSQTRDALHISPSAPAAAKSVPTDTAFDEVFFASGPSATKLAQNLKDPVYTSLLNSDASDPVANQVHTSVKAKVEELQPGFVEHFNDEIASADPYRVEAALTDGGELMMRALEAESVNPDSNVSPQCGFAAFVAVWTLAAVVNIGLGLNIETVAFVHHQAKFAESKAVFSGEQAELDRQKTVTAILNTYH